jgi:hypothetical protein
MLTPDLASRFLISSVAVTIPCSPGEEERA